MNKNDIFEKIEHTKNNLIYLTLFTAFSLTGLCVFWYEFFVGTKIHKEVGLLFSMFAMASACGVWGFLISRNVLTIKLKSKITTLGLLYVISGLVFLTAQFFVFFYGYKYHSYIINFIAIGFYCLLIILSNLKIILSIPNIKISDESAR